jgi:hypothetical protein
MRVSQGQENIDNAESDGINCEINVLTLARGEMPSSAQVERLTLGSSKASQSFQLHKDRDHTGGQLSLVLGKRNQLSFDYFFFFYCSWIPHYLIQNDE